MQTLYGLDNNLGFHPAKKCEQYLFSVLIQLLFSSNITLNEGTCICMDSLNKEEFYYLNSH